MSKRLIEIESITLSTDKQAELNDRLKKPDAIGTNRLAITRKYVYGTCLHCGGIPEKKVVYDIGDAQLLERYCDSCFKRFVPENITKLKSTSQSVS